jgi:serine/threonine protein kinase
MTELEIGAEIGEGRFGRVCVGRWLNKDKIYQVGLKFCHGKGDLNEFLREANLTISIPPHPNVVRVFGISLNGIQPVIVMEYCDGGTH